MNANLYRKELKRNRKNLMVWTLIVLGFTLFVLGFYPSIADMGTALTDLMEKLPPELGKAMGMDMTTWSGSVGYYSTYYGIYIILLMGIYTTSTGATIVSKEERDGTSEFLLTRPLSRTNIMVTKMAALFTLVGIIFLLQTLTAMAGFQFFSPNEVNWTEVSIMHGHGFILILFFTCIGVLLPHLSHPKKNFMGMVVGLIFGSYFLNALSRSSPDLEWLGYISPFHYMSFSISDPDYGFNALGSIMLLVLAFGLLYTAHWRYQSKDIQG